MKRLLCFLGLHKWTKRGIGSFKSVLVRKTCAWCGKTLEYKVRRGGL